MGEILSTQDGSFFSAADLFMRKARFAAGMLDCDQLRAAIVLRVPVIMSYEETQTFCDDLNSWIEENYPKMRDHINGV